MKQQPGHENSNQNLPCSSILQSEPITAEPDIPPQPKSSYNQILKSSAIIGGSSIINILIGIARTKFIALFLGPSGIGLIGIFTSITDLTQAVVSMGINSSGVRQIAEAAGSGNELKLAKTTQVLRRTAIFLGLLGSVFLFSFASQVSLITFDTNQHVAEIRLLSIVILFGLISGWQSALIQGMRRISDLAWMGIFSTLLGAIVSIIVIYFLGEHGIAFSIVLISAITLVASWWFSRKTKIQKQRLTKQEIYAEQSELLKLGFAFMASSLMMTVTAYLVRIIIVRKIGYDAAGLYQSAWALGGMYIGIILQAMGTDFYPRLTASVEDNIESNRLVNEQTHIGILLATPGILATFTLSPLIIEIFYSEKFQGAVELLRWFCFGMSLRVISWPMGFIIMAKGAKKLLIFSEFSWGIVYLALIWMVINTFGINGVGIAFFGSYIFHIAINFVIAKKLSNFYLTKKNLQIISLILLLSLCVFISHYKLDSISSLVIGIISVILMSIFSVLEILALVEINKFPKLAQKIIKIFKVFNLKHNKKYPEESIQKKSINRLLIIYRNILLLFIITVLIFNTINFVNVYQE